MSDEKRNAGDDDVRSSVELLHESDAKYFEPVDETMIVESNGSETSEHSSTPSEIKELIPIYENHDCLITEAVAHQEEGGIQDVCEKDEMQCLYLLHFAAERGDTVAVGSLLMSSANVDVLDTKHNTPLHISTLKGHIDAVCLLLNKNASVNSRNALGQTSLHLAAEIGHLAIAQILLKSNADVHITDQSNNTPIHIAVMHGQYELVQLLMNHSVLLICYGNRPLHLAAKCGRTEVVQLLLNNDENPDATNLDGDTPLHLASENGHFEVADVLLRNNAYINIRNASCKTPLHIAAEKGYVEIVKAMIDHEGEVNAVDGYGNTALHYAASNGHSAVVNGLLNQTTEIDAQIPSQLAVNQVSADDFQLSQLPIKTKVEVGHTSHLFASEGGNVDISDTLGSHSSTANLDIKRLATPLHHTVELGHDESLENLIYDGPNVNVCNNAKMTPLHKACQNGRTSIVEILLDNHAIVDVTKQSEETPFYLATKNGHADIVDLLLRRGFCDFVLTHYIQTPLHVAVKEGHKKVVEVILKHCRNSGKLPNDGHRPREKAKNLFETTEIKSIELFKPDGRRAYAGLIWREENTPLEIRAGSNGSNALELAASAVKPEMVRLLLSGDQCVYSEDELRESFRLMIASIELDYFFEKDLSDLEQCRVNIRELAQVLINSSKFNVNYQDNELNTLLHEALQYCGYSSGRNCELPKWFNSLHNQIINDLIQLLLEKGADYNMRNSFGETPLIIASEKGCDDAIQILFDWEHKSGMKLDLDLRDRNGATALIKAAERHNVSVMRLLLSHKASLNLCDYNCGFTALHATIYEPNRNWSELLFFCNGLHKRKFDGVHSPEICSKDRPTLRNVVDPYIVIGRLQNYIEYNKETTLFREEIVNLLLDNDEINVNAVDFRGNTPLDLAVKSSMRTTSATFEALKNRGAICNLLEPEDEAPIEVARVDERGRGPLHRLIISRISKYAVEDMKVTERKQDHERFDLMVHGILLRPENFRKSATATDDKGRTPLHYAVMLPSSLRNQDRFLVKVLLQIGSNINAADIYGKAPLHYAEMNDQYELLVQYGADENTKDIHGHTPREFKQLRDLVIIIEDIAKNLPIGKKALYPSRDSTQVLNTNHVTELTKQKVVETIRIYSQSPRPSKSSEQAIWKIWVENEFIRLIRRQSQLNPFIHQFMERLADGIKEKDWRFECQPMLVGSADEETKAVISGDFDFNFKLIKFSQLCDPFPHPLGPKGYFQLRRKTNEDTKSRSDEMFDSFFNLEQFCLTDEVNSRFQIILEEVLRDPNFWQDEHLFEWSLTDRERNKSEKPAGLCKTVRLRMIHPIEDGEGGFVFVKISTDIVACVHVEGWWPEDSLPAGISPAVKAYGSTFVFDRPRFDPSKPRGVHYPFSDTFARISFAPLESRIIKESSHLMKAAYIVCKMILYGDDLKFTYQLKTCFLFCMEALNARNGRERRSEDEITPKQLAFWVERIMFCFMEFSRHRVYPCYFLSAFRQRVVTLPLCFYDEYSATSEPFDGFVSTVLSDHFRHSELYDTYLDLCPDGTTIDIPIDKYEDDTEGSLNTNHDPNWNQFDREEFIGKLSSRNFNE